MTYFKTRSWVNVDSSHRCPLECPNCQRQTAFTFRGKVVHGRDLKMDEIEKLAKHFKSFVFCGQLSDPIHHPKFPTILNRLHELEIPEVLVHINLGKQIQMLCGLLRVTVYLKIVTSIGKIKTEKKCLK